MSIYGQMNDALLKAGVQKDVQVCFINCVYAVLLGWMV